MCVHYKLMLITVGPKRDKHEPQIIDTILTTRQQEYMDKLNTNATEFR